MARPNHTAPPGPEEWAGLRLFRVLIEIASAASTTVNPGSAASKGGEHPADEATNDAPRSNDIQDHGLPSLKDRFATVTASAA